MRVPALVAVLLLSVVNLAAADGEESYRTRCALCHGGNAAGSDRAGSILATLDASGPEQLARIITEGVPSRGMPGIEIPGRGVDAAHRLPQGAGRRSAADRPRPAGAATAGRHPFRSPGRCAGRHGPQRERVRRAVPNVRRRHPAAPPGGRRLSRSGHRAVRRLADLPRQLYPGTGTVRWTRSTGTTSAGCRCSGSFPFPTCR